jgi:hypothetical protein
MLTLDNVSSVGKGKRLTIESSLFVALDELKDRFFTAKFLLDQNME